MVYNTKGMVLIAARMMEKIHLEGKQVEQEDLGPKQLR